VDILVAAYFDVLAIDPAKPRDPGRTGSSSVRGTGRPRYFSPCAARFLSRVHAGDLWTDGSLFAEHPPAPAYLPGSRRRQAPRTRLRSPGMALAARSGLDYNVIALLSTASATRAPYGIGDDAASQRVEKIAVVIDFTNGRRQAEARRCWRSAPWSTSGAPSVERVRGRRARHGRLGAVDAQCADGSGKPVAIIAHTIKGKGVSFMEDDNNWHYRIPPRGGGRGEEELG